MCFNYVVHAIFRHLVSASISYTCRWHLRVQASVLQKAVEYIYSLEHERTYLRACNARLMRRLQSALGRDISDIDDDKDFSGVDPAKKRYNMDTESSDDGIGSMPSPLIGDLSAMDGVVASAADSLHKHVGDSLRHAEQERRSRGVVEDRKGFSINAVRCREKTCSSSSGSSANVGQSRRGSLETIVEAIRCLEDDSEMSLSNGPGVCLSATNGALVKEDYVLCDVIAAAEALQFIAGRRKPSENTSSSSSQAASSWQRQKATLADACWRSCM